jgi:hypothetical protein
VLLALVAGGSTLSAGRKKLELPSEPKVARPPDLGAVLGAEKLFARGSYWDEAGSRFVFVEPKKVRIFKPVELEVPSVEPPKIVMPLPDPGPLLRYSDGLPRIDGSMPEGAPDGGGEGAPATGGDGGEANAGGDQ